MVFSSLLFVFIFLPVTLIAYYTSPRFLRNLVLVVASLIFYGWGEPVYIVIMLFTSIFDYTNGLLIDRFRERKILTRGILTGSMIVNIGILCFFKYYVFFLNNINSLFHLQLTVKSLPLPLGISFYTFQTMSYVIDVYLGKVSAQRNIISYGTFVTMFPQLVAGPIIRYIDVATQVKSRKESFSLFGEGTELFIIGLSKKVLLANNIGILWDCVKATSAAELSVVSAWLGIIAFTFQIYFDFSGYSDMAVGLGKMFGFNFMQNFNYPYISKSITEFWRRWHISLGTWFREYLYIPLGGNREGNLKQFRNLIVVWFLTGLWHGANWNFVLWGSYYGIFIILEKAFLLRWLNNKLRFFSRIYTLLIVIVGWVLFEFENLSQGLAFIKTMFGAGSNVILDGKAIYYLYTNGLMLIILAVCSTPILRKVTANIQVKTKMAGAVVIPLIYMVLIFLCTAYLVNQSYNPFLYFRF